MIRVLILLYFASKIDTLKPVSSWIISIESFINGLDDILKLKRENIISIMLINWVTSINGRFRPSIVEYLSSFKIENVYWPLFLVVGSNIKVKVLTLITIDRWKEPCNKVMATKMNHNLLIFHVEGGGILVFNAYILKSSFCSVLRLLCYYEMEWQ